MKLGMSTPVGTGRVAARIERKNLLQVAFVTLSEYLVKKSFPLPIYHNVPHPTMKTVSTMKMLPYTGSRQCFTWSHSSTVISLEFLIKDFKNINQ